MRPVPFKDEYHRHPPITVEQNVPVPMCDGAKLYADVYRPSGGRRHPVLLPRLPYGKWCGVQSWCDGSVEMFGISYHGATQWLAAVTAPPSLKAIRPYGLASNGRRLAWHP